MDLWSGTLELQDNHHLAGLVLKLSMENFYLQITDETLNHSWLTNYFQELILLIRAFSQQAQNNAMNGGV